MRTGGNERRIGGKVRPKGMQLVAGRLGPGGARAKVHPTLGLEHPGGGWSEPLGEGGRR